MLKWLSFAFLLIGFCPWSFAEVEQYEIEAKVYWEGKLIAEPRIATVSGEKSELIQTQEAQGKNMNFTVVASEKSHPNLGEAVLLKVEVTYSQGKDKGHLKNEVLLAPGGEAKLSQAKKREQEGLFIKVSAKRK
ncbi:MAG: hypothetical protein KDD35_10505 [Bdellovibrionales bacterium]|nr:hypothetical protein [Bdellovibrionales bacterium]